MGQILDFALGTSATEEGVAELYLPFVNSFKKPLVAFRDLKGFWEALVVLL